MYTGEAHPARLHSPLFHYYSPAVLEAARRLPCISVLLPLRSFRQSGFLYAPSQYTPSTFSRGGASIACHRSSMTARHATWSNTPSQLGSLYPLQSTHDPGAFPYTRNPCYVYGYCGNGRMHATNHLPWRDFAKKIHGETKAWISIELPQPHPPIDFPRLIGSEIAGRA